MTTMTTRTSSERIDIAGREVNIPVLDKGYVRIIDTLGSDLAVVNAARASFAKESESFTESDGKLLRFLIREGHWSPFRHAMITFEIKAPLMVCRQHWKYVVGSDHTMDAWNETSRRYVTIDTEFYVPANDQWRSQPDNMKQGSGGPIDPWAGAELTAMLQDLIVRCDRYYKLAGEYGVATEQARLFLPAYGLYTNYRWTASLQSVCHFLNQRMEEDAQKEIQDYARAVFRLVQPRFPVTINELVKTKSWT